MGSCKFGYRTWKCPLNVEDEGDFCFWHQKIDGKEPNQEELTELKKQKINGVYLKKAKLDEANLHEAYLSGAELQKASLFRANLQGADLSIAKLDGAHLVDAKLQGANLNYSSLKEANLRGTELSEANLNYSNLLGVDLTQSNLQKAKLFKAELQGANLSYTNLQWADLSQSNLERANLIQARLHGANLSSANLRGADCFLTNLYRTKLVETNLQNTYLERANLQRANLIEANLEGANLTKANIQGANMKLTVFDSVSRLDGTELKDVNIHLSYVDYAKSFRNASFFNQKDQDEKEINEKIADSLINNSSHYSYKSDLLFEVDKINEYIAATNDTVYKNIFNYLRDQNKIKSPIWSQKDIDYDPDYILYSDILDFITELGKGKASNKIKNKIDNLLFREEMEQSFFFYNPIFKKYSGFVIVSSKNRFLYSKNRFQFNRVDKVELYEASKEVYSKLHHFYLNEGMTFREKHAHYRRAEVDRKLLLVRNKWNSFEGLKDRARSWLFDWFVLKVLTGYGENVLRPVLISIFWIIAFGFIYMILEGVKVVGRAANWFDYFYLSMTTFTSLGFADVQPDITVKWMQPLIMAESTMGVAMVALIIFVITYQISR